MRKYQGLIPGARPVEGLEFRGESVFLKKHVTELHTPERWLKYRREVKPRERPVKSVTGMYNDPNKTAELFGFWQTRPYKLQLTPGGRIPRNAHGNIEMFTGPLPPETCLIDVP